MRTIGPLKPSYASFYIKCIYMYICLCVCSFFLQLEKNVVSGSMAAVLTVVVEDSQPEMVQPDNQESLTQETQLQPPETSDSQEPQGF